MKRWVIRKYERGSSSFVYLVEPMEPIFGGGPFVLAAQFDSEAAARQMISRYKPHVLYGFTFQVEEIEVEDAATVTLFVCLWHPAAPMTASDALAHAATPSDDRGHFFVQGVVP